MDKRIQAAAWSGIIALVLISTSLFFRSFIIDTLATLASVIFLFGFCRIAKKEKQQVLHIATMLAIVLSVIEAIRLNFSLIPPSGPFEDMFSFLSLSTDAAILAAILIPFGIALFTLRKPFGHYANWTTIVSLSSGIGFLLTSYTAYFTTTTAAAGVSPMLLGVGTIFVLAATTLVAIAAAIMQIVLLFKAAKKYK